jgi:ribosomal-protein-alanine N-acetyltransferase
MPRNGASLRVMEKLAIRKEGLAERYLQIAGRWEDHVIFAMTSEEWRRKGEPGADGD